MSNGGERRACEFHLLRYVPDAGRNEYVHIGVILREQGSVEGPSRLEPPRVRCTRDWRRVRCLDREADRELLEAVESELRVLFAAEQAGNLIGQLRESLSLS